MYWNKREIARAQNTNTHTHIIETRNSDANPATCSFRRAFRYIEDQIKSSHRISIRLLNTISESIQCRVYQSYTLLLCARYLNALSRALSVFRIFFCSKAVVRRFVDRFRVQHLYFGKKQFNWLQM